MDFEWLLAIFCLLDGRTFLLCMLIGSLVSRGFSHVLLSKQCVFQYPPLNEVSCVSCESSRLLISPKHHIFFAPTNELWNIVLLFTVKNRLSSRNPDWICFNFCMLLILSWTQILRARLFSQVLDSRRDREPLWWSPDIRMRGLGESLNPIFLRRKLPSSFDRYHAYNRFQRFFYLSQMT